MNECIVRAFDREVITIALRQGDLYQVTFNKVCEMNVANVAQTSTIDGALELWHRRLGHLNIKGVHALQNMVSGMNLGNMPCPTSSFLCEGCIEGKQHCKPFPSDGGMRATEPLEIVHSDVCGPMRTTSLGGARYFLTYIDDFSRKVWVYLLKSKGECLKKFKEFKALVETQSEHKMKVFWLDNGGEYISKRFECFLRAHGIEKQTSTPYRPQQNGVAKRANCTLVEMAKSMLHGQNLKKSLWAETMVMRPTQGIDVHQERCHPSHLRKCGVGESLAFHTCVCLDALRMPWCRMKRGVNLMQRAQNVCFLGVVKAPRHIGSCVCNPRRSSSVGMLSSWRIALVSTMIWRCIQVGEMRTLMW